LQTAFGGGGSLALAHDDRQHQVGLGVVTGGQVLRPLRLDPARLVRLGVVVGLGALDLVGEPVALGAVAVLDPLDALLESGRSSWSIPS
jgi:hypothetical protein